MAAVTEKISDTPSQWNMGRLLLDSDQKIVGFAGILTATGEARHGNGAPADPGGIGRSESGANG